MFPSRAFVKATTLSLALALVPALVPSRAAAVPVRGLAKPDQRLLAKLEGIRLQKAAVKNGRFDFAGADRAYAQAFRDLGIDVEKLDTEKAAGLIRSQPIAAELTVALDDWAMTRRAAGNDKKETWKRLLTVARAADNDRLRNLLRDALLKGDNPALKKMATLPEFAKQPPATAALLGNMLAQTGAVTEAVAVLRQAQQRHPGDFWLNFQLADYLTRLRPSRLKEAVRYCKAALALRPQNPAVYGNLGSTLLRQGKIAEAVTALRKALQLQPDFVPAHLTLAAALVQQGKPAEAEAACRKAIALDPKNAAAHAGLAEIFRQVGKLAESVAEFRKAIALDPKFVRAHVGLGDVMRQIGRFAEAVACYRRALALQPDLPSTYVRLGGVLIDQGRLAEGVACLRNAIRLDPKNPAVHCALGSALAKQGKREEAIAEYREALRLMKDFPEARRRLDALLKKKGKK
jgi:tetratricopeptide (TPR) repeat protein